VVGRWWWRHGPWVQSISSLPLFVISYLPSSRLVISPSWTMPSRSGYTDPGDGRHQPMLAFSTSVIISAPFLGVASSMESIHGRSQPLLLGPNMFYRLFDIAYSIVRFKGSAQLSFFACLRGVFCSACFGLVFVSAFGSCSGYVFLRPFASFWVPLRPFWSFCVSSRL